MRFLWCAFVILRYHSPTMKQNAEYEAVSFNKKSALVPPLTLGKSSAAISIRLLKRARSLVYQQCLYRGYRSGGNTTQALPERLPTIITYQVPTGERVTN